MRVLIVESNEALAMLWANHLERSGAAVQVALTEEAAIAAVESDTLDLIIMDVMLDQRSALAVSDLAQFRQPRARVIFVSSSSFFSDGSIFNLYPNACAYLPSGTSPDDLCAVAAHYAAA
ncbi:response regulator [Sagittula sp. S175]|uniref:response regulator n=1 Tax=Sagittula sp. S175 TaxID=3415129 RepID=UPI003C7B3A39